MSLCHFVHHKYSERNRASVVRGRPLSEPWCDLFDLIANSKLIHNLFITKYYKHGHVCTVLKLAVHKEAL